MFGKIRMSLAMLVIYSAIILTNSSAMSQNVTGSAATGVWGVGVQIGMVEFGTHVGYDANILLQGLNFARELAVASGCIPTADIDVLISAMRNTRDTRSLNAQVNQYRIRLATIVGTNCVCGASTAAGSLDPACDTYARTAVEQANLARRAGCPGIGGPSWDSTYQDHYGWCRQVSQGFRDAETQARAAALAACGVRWPPVR